MTIMQIADTATVASYIKLIAPDFKILEITLVCVNFLEEAVILYA